MGFASSSVLVKVEPISLTDVVSTIKSSELNVIKDRSLRGNKKATQLLIHYLLWVNFPSTSRKSVLLKLYTKYKKSVREPLGGN